MTDYGQGYQDGLAVVGIDKLCFASTSLESAANWLMQSEKHGALQHGDKLRIALYASAIHAALEDIKKLLPIAERRIP
jgi:hypothetical protein